MLPMVASSLHPAHFWRRLRTYPNHNSDVLERNEGLDIGVSEWPNGDINLDFPTLSACLQNSWAAFSRHLKRLTPRTWTMDK